MAKTKFRFNRDVRELTVTLDYEDTTAQDLFKLPNNARILEWVVNVTTAFSGGTATLDVGKEGDTDYFIDGQAVSSVGMADLTTALAKPGEELSALTQIQALVGSGNSAGELELTCVFSIEQGTPI